MGNTTGPLITSTRGVRELLALGWYIILNNVPCASGGKCHPIRVLTKRAAFTLYTRALFGQHNMLNDIDNDMIVMAECEGCHCKIAYRLPNDV